MMLQPTRLRGIGDWSDPSCEPGSPGCVPHWYCYVPLMATPDCLASFGQGVKEIGGAVGSTVGSTVGSAIGGAVQGVVGGVLDPQGSGGSGVGLPGLPNWVLPVGLGIAGLVIFMAVRK